MLEARWAVFFDALDIKYLYEPQGFVTDGKPYLPDFCLLLGGMIWAEVKPAFDTDPDGVERWKSFVRARGETGLLLTDMTSKPGPFLYLDQCGGEPYEDWAQWCACENGYHFRPVPPCRFIFCKDCSPAEIAEGDYYNAVDFLDDGYRHFRIEAAYAQARSCRFDRR